MTLVLVSLIIITALFCAGVYVSISQLRVAEITTENSKRTLVQEFNSEIDRYREENYALTRNLEQVYREMRSDLKNQTKSIIYANEERFIRSSLLKMQNALEMLHRQEAYFNDEVPSFLDRVSRISLLGIAVEALTNSSRRRKNENREAIENVQASMLELRRYLEVTHDLLDDEN